MDALLMLTFQPLFGPQFPDSLTVCSQQIWICRNSSVMCINTTEWTSAVAQFMGHSLLGYSLQATQLNCTVNETRWIQIWIWTWKLLVDLSLVNTPHKWHNETVYWVVLPMFQLHSKFWPCILRQHIQYLPVCAIIIPWMMELTGHLWILYPSHPQTQWCNWVQQTGTTATSDWRYCNF